ncbi:putative DNA-directed RNA polymerase iii 130 kda polypeptide protein [Cladorrhinum sp. PSN259]|nr:putative DNA-directed RNA polymerase iii 130 kda polypeptide protein [Cladorrhinum sp. PSN259]
MSSPARTKILPRCPSAALSPTNSSYFRSPPPAWATNASQRNISSSSSKLPIQPPSPPLPSSSATLTSSSPVPHFNFSTPPPSPSPPPNDPEQARKVKLGTTLRILQTHLPRLLQTPLPSEILSPHITLYLFPSTHPHLPTVTGRVAYIAALWSSPIAWNRVPIVGNVRLEMLSERMIKEPTHTERRKGAVGEQLVVRWRTVGKGQNGVKKLWFGEGENSGKQKVVGTSQAVGEGKEFTGLFIFDFDGEGRILSHTIEHVQEGGQWEGSGLGAKVVGLTDWLLGGIKGDTGGGACPAFQRVRVGERWSGNMGRER